MYEKELQNLGLSEKEAKVYTTALELGADTVQNIAKQSGINRATTYVQIGSLKEKGLISEFEKGKKTYFVAESPNRLKNLVKTLESEVQTKKRELESVLDKLLGMHDTSGERPKVRFFEGIEGAEAMREDFLNSKAKSGESFTDADKIQMLFGAKRPEHNKQRITKKIKAFVLYTSKNGKIKGYSDPKMLRETRYIKYSPLAAFEADVNMYANKTSIITYSDHPIGVIIESEAITSTLRAIFYTLWEQGEK